MGNAEATSVTCNDCGKLHDPAAVDQVMADERVPCTRCGSDAVKVDGHVTDTITMRDGLDLTGLADRA